MLATSLTAAETAVVASAANLLKMGRAREAAQAVAPMLAAGSRHPDPLMIYSAACEQLGQIPDAISAAQAAVNAAPERADLWATLGRILHEQGSHGQGAEMLERAVALDPAAANNWYNLGLAAGGAGQSGRALEAIGKATQLAPDWAMAWGGLGYLQQQSGALEQAETSLRRALELDPTLRSASHALVVTLRMLDRSEDALEAAAGTTVPETLLVRAHVLAELGRGEAVDAYRLVLAERPDLLDGHETLARLMPQLGRTAEALDSYREALARAPSLELYRSALQSARDVGDHETLIAWAEQARRQFGDLPDLVALGGLGLAQRGDTQGALAVLEPLAASGFGEVLGHCAYARLKLGDLDAAERHALAATEHDFADQSPWAYLSVIWRLTGDPREQWLADYERLVMPIALEPPEGFEDIEGFMAALAQDLHRLHSTTEHPAEQSLRNGTQTRGLLFSRRSPTIRALADQIVSQVEASLAALPSDSTHPFLARNTGRIRFAGSWSVRLRSSGFHVSHIHHNGWLSSALYVALPDSVGKDSGDASSPGALVFGVPPQDLGLDIAPSRVERPKVGRLVVFPSYFWHGTVPFESDHPRLTVAFDALPA